MLVVKIEYWPSGNPRLTEVIEQFTIVNDLTGTLQSGNYVVNIHKRNSKLSGHNRADSPIHLLRRALVTHYQEHGNIYPRPAGRVPTTNQSSKAIADLVAVVVSQVKPPSRRTSKKGRKR